MAFQKENKLRKCAICDVEQTYFKMLDWVREATKYPKDELEETRKYWRVCVDCELRMRLEEWEKMTHEEKEKEPKQCHTNTACWLAMR